MDPCLSNQPWSNIYLKILKCLFYFTNYITTTNFEKHMQEVISGKHGFHTMAVIRIIKFNIKFNLNLFMLIGSFN